MKKRVERRNSGEEKMKEKPKAKEEGLGENESDESFKNYKYDPAELSHIKKIQLRFKTKSKKSKPALPIT